MSRSFFSVITPGIVAVSMLFAAITALPLSAHAQTLRSVDQWESMFQSSWASELSTYGPKSTSGDEWPIYDMAYPLNANYMMFKATGKTQYLDRALLYINNLMNTARVSSSFPKSQFKDGYLTWINHTHPDLGDDGKEYPLFESFGWRYVAAILYAMKQNSTVYNDPHYRAEYDKILAFTERNIWDKWYHRGLSNLYRTHTHMASHWAMIGMYLSKLTEDPTRRSQAETVAKNIAYAGIPSYGGASIKGQLRPHSLDSSAYFFNWEWNKFSTPGSDVSHGNAVGSFMVEANCIGFAYTTDDMQKMANLVKNVLIPRTPLYVDGSGSRALWLIDGFMQLGRYDRELAQKLETSGGGLGTSRAAAGALNTLILNGGRCTGVNTSGGGGGGGGGGNDTTCQNQYTKSTSVPSGYGASYNLFTSAKELLVQGDTCTTASYKIKVGSGDAAQLIYKNGYKWTGSRWDIFDLSSDSTLQSNTWYTGSSTVNVTPVSGGTYVVGYVCQRVSDVWKCGCSNTACTTAAWQLQKVSK
jgi:hypothetical protein